MVETFKFQTLRYFTPQLIVATLNNIYSRTTKHVWFIVIGYHIPFEGQFLPNAVSEKSSTAVLLVALFHQRT